MRISWRRFRLFLILLVLLPGDGSAEGAGSLSGRVRDASGGPLAGVDLTLRGPVESTARTDAEGRFAFEALPPGEYTLEASSPLGAARVAVAMAAGAAVARDVTLGTPRVRVAESVSVLAPAPQPLATVPGGAAVVDRAEILDTRAQNLRDVFGLTPGVLAQPRFGADESQLSIRGSGLRNNFHLRGVNLFVNGIPYQDADGFSDFESLELMAASRLEVWKGANALRFGGNSSGGAINLVTEDGSDASPLQFRGVGGSYGYAKGQISSGGRLGDAAYYGSLSGLTSDGYREHSQQRRERIFGNLSVPLSPETDLTFDLMQAHVSEKIPGALTREEMATDPHQAEPNNVVNDWGRFYDYFRGGVRVTRRLAGGAELSVTGFGSYRNMDHPIFLVIDQDSRNFGGEVRYVLESTLLGRPNRLVAGFVPFFGNIEERDYVNEAGARGPLADAFRTSAGNLGVFVEDQLDVSSSLTLVLGARAERSTRSYQDRVPGDGDRSDSRTYEAVSPKLGLLWSAGVGVEVFANASRSYEPPLLLELKSYGSPGMLPLEAQDTWQYEVGSRGKPSPRLSWDVSLFDLEIRNEVVNLNVRPFPTAPFTIPTYRNVPRSRHRGAEVGLGGVIAENVLGRGRLSARAAWTYSDFRFVNDSDYGDNVLPGAPRHLLRVRLRYDGPGGLWVSPELDASPSPYFVDSANTTVNDRYVVWNLTAGWDGPAFGVFFELSNVGDTVYSASVQVDSDVGRYFEPANGRSVSGGFRWRM